MTCKDCIHYDVCMYKNRQIPLCDEFYYETDHVEDIGCPFIDKSKFIKVPRKVGDVVYVVYADKIQITSIYSIKIETEQDHWIFIYKCLVANGGSRFEKFIYNKTLFFSREEAEKALKEREKQ